MGTYKEAEKLQSEGEFSVSYIFRKAFVTDKTVYGVAFHLVSENNSVWIGVGSKNADGDSTAIKADLGSKNRVDITPEKHLFLHQKGICQVKYAHRHKARQLPDLLIHKTYVLNPKIFQQSVFCQMA